MTRDELIAAVRARIAQMNTVLTTLTDETALESAVLFPVWHQGETYEVGARMRYNDKLYRVVQTHTSQLGWEPDITPALFTEIAMPGTIAEWKQPTGAQDAYNTGDRVIYNGQTWESTVDNNVWTPGTGNLWTLVEI